MAANDYFINHPANPKPSRLDTAPSYSQDPYSSASPYLTPQPSNQQVGPSPLTPHGQSPFDDPPSAYNEHAPLKPFKIDTNTAQWASQNAQHPSSPGVPTPIDPSQPARRRRKKKKKGFFAGPIPWLTYVLTLVQLTVFIVEIIKNSIITGSPIMIKPQFNPMIGPSTYVLINMGARFVPCMRTTPGVQDATDTLYWACPSTTTSDPNSASNKCTLSELCGMGGINESNPNQWWRFIVPMFLHAGVIHIGFNMLLQMTMGREMERIIGSVRYGLVYFSSGIFGFVLGGNFAAGGIASTGASGSLFGILALVLLDLLYSWQERTSPVKDLMWIICDIVISFVLGLLPGLDNFSHIGGFLMGLVLGICILHSPKALRRRIKSSTPYSNVDSQTDIALASGGLGAHRKSGVSDTSSPISTTKDHTMPTTYSKFTSRPVGFFKGRKPLWWAWWLIRAGALIGVLIGFIVLITNFYKYRSTCSWCKYLSCLPINNWCDLGNLNFTNTTGTSKRALAVSEATVRVFHS